MNNLLLRLKAEMPEFWKKVRKHFLYLGLVFTLIFTASEIFHFENWILQVCKYGIIVCITVTGTASFTVKDSNQINDKS